MGIVSRFRQGVKETNERLKGVGVETPPDQDVASPPREDVAPEVDRVSDSDMNENDGSSVSAIADKLSGAHVPVGQFYSSDGSQVSSVPVGRHRSHSMNLLNIDKTLKQIIADNEDSEGNEEEIIDVSKLSRSERQALKEAMGNTLELYPHLMAIKPKESYVFHSDYFSMDNDRVGCVLAFFHKDEAVDNFSAFWGTDRIPYLGQSVSTVVLEQVSRMAEKWVDSKIQLSDKLGKLSDREQRAGGNIATKRFADKMAMDREEIVAEIQDGASYLNIHHRLIVHAPTLDQLDDALEKLRRYYIERFSTITAEPYQGDQRNELSNLMKNNEYKRGKGAHLTSTEFAGSYSLVTNGLNDPDGQYVGDMSGDYNTSAILFAVNRWRERVVVADNTRNAVTDSYVSDMWGSKISQDALLHNNRVVHIILNDADLDRLGPPLSSITTHLDMTRGDINPFELFGRVQDELTVFPVHIEKLVLMTRQLMNNGVDKEDALITDGKLRAILNNFYIGKGMWYENAKENRDKLRLVGLDHKEVPQLSEFISYLNTAKKSMMSSAQVESEMEAIVQLQSVYNTMLSNHGDLFNNFTSDSLDSVYDSRRIIYNLADLKHRGLGVAMAQLVNVIGFATEMLQNGDVVIIHGCDNIQSLHVQDFLSDRFKRLRRKGVRVALLYEDVDSMLEHQRFNLFTRADYTLLGPMSYESLIAYQNELNQTMPPDLVNLVRRRNSEITYLRRGVNNVVFVTNMLLGVNPNRPVGRSTAPTTAHKTTSEIDDGSARAAHRGGGMRSPGAVSAMEAVALEAEQENRDQRLAAARAERFDDPDNVASTDGDTHESRTVSPSAASGTARQATGASQPSAAQNPAARNRMPKAGVH